MCRQLICIVNPTTIDYISKKTIEKLLFTVDLEPCAACSQACLLKFTRDVIACAVVHLIGRLATEGRVGKSS